MINVSAYLGRIGYEGTPKPDYETLRALHIAHLHAVPFENLDIHLKRPIVIDEERLFDKIVVRRRGGFCYELNGLFAALLRAIGFDVTYLSASDAHDDGSYGPEFDHLLLLVRTASSPAAAWLADVGWGDSFREPLAAYTSSEQLQNGRAYWLEPQGEYRLLWQRDASGKVERQYRFSFEPRALSDFEEMCRYHQTSSDSSFTRRQICTLATETGRVTLADSRLITTRDGVREERVVGGEEEYRRLLESRFGIVLGD